MNLFELSAKITADTSGFDKSLGQTKKSMSEYKKDVMVLAQTYKKQGMDMSAAMKKAYAEIDKSQYETSENSKEDSKKFAKNWEDAGGKVGSVAKKMGTGFATMAKIGISAVGAAAAGITALTTAAVNNYAEYEQLVGGVDTLFKTSSQKVQEYAANAYKTAGMSANEYMSTVTSFSASLLQSLGGDTEAAAEYANQALTDMSDNANKMGTSMEMIQNAYQGFAKQNYTMLDNLKLGYGGTKTEMERLLRDAEKMGGLVEGAFDIDSFADVVEAINIVQTEMGITGTTAKEAASTIQGSVGMMKSAWKNLVTGIADENANLDVLLTNLVDSVGTVAENLIPKIEVALGSIASLIEKLAPVVVEALPSLVSSVVPSLISAATDMVNAVIAVVPDLLNTVVTALVDNAPALITAAIGLVQSLIQGIQDNYQILVDGAIQIVTQLATGILNMLPQIVKLGLDLIVSLANGIAQAIPNLIPTIVSVVLEIVNTLTNPDTLSNLINASVEIILALANGLIEAIPDLVDAIPAIVESLISAIMGNLGLIIEAGIQVSLAILQGIISAIPQLVSAAIQIITFLAQSITNPENVQKIIDTAGELINSLIEGFNNVLDSLIDVGGDVVEQIKKGISDAWDGLKKWFNDIWDSLFGNRRVNVDVGHPSIPESEGVVGTFGRQYDSYYDLTHNGERFLTVAKRNQRNGGSVANTSGVTIIQNIQAVPQTPVELAAATSAYFEQARWAF